MLLKCIKDIEHKIRCRDDSSVSSVCYICLVCDAGQVRVGSGCAVNLFDLL
jgi:hypothetical protein